VDVFAGAAPAPFNGTDESLHLAYELHFREATGRQDVTLERLAVLEGQTSAALVVYDASDLDQRTMRPGASPATRYGRLIPRGAITTVHIWIAVEPGQRVPRSLRHRITFNAGNTESISEFRVDVRTSVPVVLGAPLRGGLWLAHNGPGAHRAAHWGSVLVQGSRATIPQRYAIDFVGLDETGRGVRGNVQGSSNTDWIGFGAEVLAVADGIVREARDGAEDWPPLFEPPRPAGLTLRDVGGNYVVLELPGRRFVHYVHLQQGSVLVRPGQRVRRGNPLGRLGNSGNTNGPHLHFNVVDDASMEKAEGVPFVFDVVEMRGNTTPDAVLGEGPIEPTGPVRIRRALPLNAAIVSFP
jgi:murein DD-endopeptidase MepM/ murein hydrolase activator NlpD